MSASSSTTIRDLESRVKEAQTEGERISKELDSARSALAEQTQKSQTLAESVSALQEERDRLTSTYESLQEQYQTTLTALEAAKADLATALAEAAAEQQVVADERAAEGNISAVIKSFKTEKAGLLDTVSRLNGEIAPAEDDEAELSDTDYVLERIDDGAAEGEAYMEFEMRYATGSDSGEEADSEMVSLVATTTPRLLMFSTHEQNVAVSHSAPVTSSRDRLVQYSLSDPRSY